MGFVWYDLFDLLDLIDFHSIFWFFVEIYMFIEFELCKLLFWLLIISPHLVNISIHFIIYVKNHHFFNKIISTSMHIMLSWIVLIFLLFLGKIISITVKIQLFVLCYFSFSYIDMEKNKIEIQLVFLYSWFIFHLGYF